MEEEAVPVSRLMDRLQDVAGIKVFILDACRDNPFATRLFRRRGVRGGGKGLAESTRIRAHLSPLQRAQAIPRSMGKESTALMPRRLSTILATGGAKSG